MLPPPAPISTSSTVVIRTGRPLPGAKRLSLAASKEYETSGWPLSIIAIFAVVPPMSKAISRSSFCSLPIRAAESALLRGQTQVNQRDDVLLLRYL